jgi:tRNA nucleotidyltransferase/poly(A) polymerase
MKMYTVGGCVRDEIIGRPSKDIDFTVVLNDQDMNYWFTDGIGSPFQVMRNELVMMGFKIFLETPEFLTIRAQFPKEDRFYGEGPLTGMGYMRRQSADFVLARKDGAYTDGRRPDEVIAGTLEDDLARRDFTMNAIAKDGDAYIDPFNGRRDIADRLIVTVGDPLDRLTEDGLRALRAIRFAVTLGFKIDTRTAFALQNSEVLDLVVKKVHDDRKRVEIEKMFRFDTLASLKMLGHYPLLTEAVFSGSLSLDASLKTKNRGK